MSSKIVINLNPKLSGTLGTKPVPIVQPVASFVVQDAKKEEFIKKEIKTKITPEVQNNFLDSPAFGSILDHFPEPQKSVIEKKQEVGQKTVEKLEKELEKKLNFVDFDTDENYIKPSKFRIISRVLVASLLICSILTFGFVLTNFGQPSSAAVAGVMSESPENEGFNLWLKKYQIQDLVQTGDTDEDGLTNWEEYKLGTDPTKSKTCGQKTDGQNLLELIDPKTCAEIDLENDEEIARFAEFINTTNSQTPEIELPKEKTSNLKQLFGTDYEKLDKLSQAPSKYNQGFEDKIETQNQKLALISKINKYIQANRSFEPKDRDYEIPVLGSQYLEISEQFKVPLKYFLAIAKLESRFGTDRFDSSGNQTRPFRFKNIFSMGLDDSGGNIGFATWADGVKSFGKWYNRLSKVSDCAKWKIYNPNIDGAGFNYCQKVEALASEIQNYLEN